MTYITYASAHGAKDMLGRQQTDVLWPLPTVQDDQDAEKRGSIEQKDRRGAGSSDDETAQGRADGAGQVEARTVECYGCR